MERLFSRKPLRHISRPIWRFVPPQCRPGGELSCSTESYKRSVRNPGASAFFSCHRDLDSPAVLLAVDTCVDRGSPSFDLATGTCAVESDTKRAERRKAEPRLWNVEYGRARSDGHATAPFCPRAHDRHTRSHARGRAPCFECCLPTLRAWRSLRSRHFRLAEQRPRSRDGGGISRLGKPIDQCGQRLPLFGRGAVVLAEFEQCY
jgi:hypothetical protein